MKKKMASMVVSVVMALSLTAAFTPAWAEDTASVAEETASAEQGTIGEKSSDSDYHLEVTNGAGVDIKAIAISIDQADYTDLALSGEGLFKADETRTLYCTPKTKNEDGTDVTKPPVYDLKVTFADDREAVLHTLPFGDAESLKICFEDPVAYIVFKSLSRSEEFNTLVSEKVKSGLMTSEEAYGSADDGYGGDEDYDDYDYDDYDYDDGGSGGNACLDDAVLY